MKYIFTLFFSTLAGLPSYAQLCNCNAIAGNQNKFYKSSDAVQVINAFSSLFRFPPTIIPEPFACAGDYISAQMCRIEITERLRNGGVKTRFEDRRYIFYDSTFMDKVRKNRQSGSEDFLIAHEIAHHVLGHTYFNYTVKNGGARMAVEAPHDHLWYTEKSQAQLAKGKKNKPASFKESLRSKTQELEADALAIWMVYKKNGLASTDKIFNDLIAVYSEMYKTKIDEKNDRLSEHPSFYMRKEIARGVRNRLNTKNLTSITSDSTVRINFEHDILSFYNYLIVTADEETRKQFTELEKQEWEEANRNRNVYVELVGGLQAQVPSFKKDGVPVSATTGYGASAGVRIGTGKWYQKHHFETDLRVNVNAFSTQADENGELKNAENFRITQIQVQPRYVFGKLNRKNNYRLSSSGLLVSLGASVQIPLFLNYENKNFTGGPTEKPNLRPSIAPVLGAGWGVSKWFDRRGHSRVWVSYSPQWLLFEKSQHISALQHTFSLDFTYRLW